MTDFVFAGWMGELYHKKVETAGGWIMYEPLISDWGWDDDDINPVPQPPVDFPVPAVFRFNPNK